MQYPTFLIMSTTPGAQPTKRQIFTDLKFSQGSVLDKSKKHFVESCRDNSLSDGISKFVTLTELYYHFGNSCTVYLQQE